MNKILILGATGMLGHTLTHLFSQNEMYKTYATTRKNTLPSRIKDNCKKVYELDVMEFNALSALVSELKPDYIINCIGLIKQLPAGQQPIPLIRINALFPHLLAELCESHSVKLIHFSTDCVFSGDKGNYTEASVSDATDLYGKSKALGELSTYPNALTLRTSIIGHELSTSLGLLEWFLHEKGTVQGFDKAIYTGFPTTEIYSILTNYIINKNIRGLYNVSSAPISKYNLLKIITKYYEVPVKIEKNENFFCDRSLNSDAFQKAYQYTPPSWDTLIRDLAAYHQQNKDIYN